MSPISEKKVRNEKDWDLSVLRYELEQLRRERFHLAAKQNERPLTHFERDRVASIGEEMSNIIRTVVNYNRQLHTSTAA